MNPRNNRKREKQLGVVAYISHSIAIAKQINIILQKSGKSQAELAGLLGKSESEVSKWLRGSHNFTLKTLSKIEEALGEPIFVCVKDVKPEVRCFFAASSDVPLHTAIAVVNKTNNKLPKDATYTAVSTNESYLVECNHNSN